VESNLQVVFEINGSKANGANITCPVLIQRIQTNHSSVASGVGMGGGRSSALGPQGPGKL